VARSNVTASNIYDGERIDDTLPELPVVGASLLDAAEAGAATARLCDRLSLPVVAHAAFLGELLRTPAGEAVIDLGQEITGTFRLRVSEPAGTVVRVQCAELLQDGNFYRDNLRTAKSEFVYVSDGAEHVLEPRFTFYGYRYAKIEVDGRVPERFDAADFTGVALWSDFEEIGRLSTGNALVNQLVSNATWGMRDNFLDTPTDCPQRDERLGWTGDAQVFSPTALYLADQYPFYRKYLHDMALEQQKLGGAVPMVVPAFMLNTAANAVWGDVTCIIPWNMYLMSGDASILAEHFDSMRGWVDYVVGLRYVREEPGFRRAIVAPTPNWRLGSVSCDYRASVGAWHVGWRCVDETHLHVELTVPFGCTAEVALPFADESAYEELGGHVLAAGVYELTYQTSELLRRMPTVDWPLARLMERRDTAAVVYRHCYHPEFLLGDPDTSAMSVRELAPAFGRDGGPMSAEALDACEADLRALWD